MSANYCFSYKLIFLSVACNDCKKNYIFFVCVNKGLVCSEKG